MAARPMVATCAREPNVKKKKKNASSRLFSFFSGEGRSVLCVVPPGYHQVRLWTCSSYYLLGRLFIRPLHCPCFRVRIHQSVAPLSLVIPIICWFLILIQRARVIFNSLAAPFIDSHLQLMMPISENGNQFPKMERRNSHRQPSADENVARKHIK